MKHKPKELETGSKLLKLFESNEPGAGLRASWDLGVGVVHLARHACMRTRAMVCKDCSPQLGCPMELWPMAAALFPSLCAPVMLQGFVEEQDIDESDVEYGVSGAGGTAITAQCDHCTIAGAALNQS